MKKLFLKKQADHNVLNSCAHPEFGTISKTSRFLSQIFRNPDFCSKFPENPNTFTKKMLNSTNYTVVLDYLRQNLNMQPFIVLHNQNIPDFYFLRPLYFKNIQAFHQIGRRWDILFLPKWRRNISQSWLPDLERWRHFRKFLFD